MRRLSAKLSDLVDLEVIRRGVRAAYGVVGCESPAAAQLETAAAVLHEWIGLVEADIEADLQAFLARPPKQRRGR